MEEVRDTRGNRIDENERDVDVQDIMNHLILLRTCTPHQHSQNVELRHALKLV